MPIPSPVFYPPFNITRISHTVLTSRDPARSRDFYTEVYGLIVTEEDGDVVYLRGIEEACHHSLVLKRADAEPVCETVGFRVLTEEELEKAEQFFIAENLAPHWVETPYQGRTLRVSDPNGVPLEFCARMDRVNRADSDHNAHKGACGLRFDHMQLHAADVVSAFDLYNRLGFRVSDYMTAQGGNNVLGVFSYRKDIPWDIVFLAGRGPRMHHFAYVTRSFQNMMRACDITGQMGYGDAVERGPGRHTMGHVQFVYIRDPDGHRCEILLDAPHQMLDMEIEPVEWDVSGIHQGGWGLPAQRTWFEEASNFPGVKTAAPENAGAPFSLEDYVEQRAAQTRASQH